MALNNAGVAPKIAMELTGHLTMSVYNRYGIGDKQSKRMGVEKLAAYYAGREAEPRKVVPLKTGTD